MAVAQPQTNAGFLPSRSYGVAPASTDAVLLRVSQKVSSSTSEAVTIRPLGLSLSYVCRATCDGFTKAGAASAVHGQTAGLAVPSARLRTPSYDGRPVLPGSRVYGGRQARPVILTKA